MTSSERVLSHTLRACTTDERCITNAGELSLDRTSLSDIKQSFRCIEDCCLESIVVVVEFVADYVLAPTLNYFAPLQTRKFINSLICVEKRMNINWWRRECIEVVAKWTSNNAINERFQIDQLYTYEVTDRIEDVGKTRNDKENRWDSHYKPQQSLSSNRIYSSIGRSGHHRCDQLPRSTWICSISGESSHVVSYLDHGLSCDRAARSSQEKSTLNMLVSSQTTTDNKSSSPFDLDNRISLEPMSRMNVLLDYTGVRVNISNSLSGFAMWVSNSKQASLDELDWIEYRPSRRQDIIKQTMLFVRWWVLVVPFSWPEIRGSQTSTENRRSIV